MTCFIAQNLLSEFMDGALEPARSAELQGHLQGCPHCTRELAQIRRVRAMLRGLPVERAPSDLLAKVRARVERKTVFQRISAAIGGFHVPRLAVSGTLAAAALLFLAVTVLFNDHGRTPGGLLAQRSESAPPAENKLGADTASADGERQTDNLEAPDRLVADGRFDKDASKAAAPAPPDAGVNGGFAVPAAPQGKSIASLDRQEPKPAGTPMAAAAAHAAPTPAPTVVAFADDHLRDQKNSGNLDEKTSSAGRGDGSVLKPAPTSTPMVVAVVRTPPPVAQPTSPGLYYRADAPAPTPATTVRRKEQPQQQDSSGREAEPAFSTADTAPTDLAKADTNTTRSADVTKGAEGAKKTKVAAQAPAATEAQNLPVADAEPAGSGPAGGERGGGAVGGAAGGGASSAGDDWGSATGSTTTVANAAPKDENDRAEAEEVVTTGMPSKGPAALAARWTSPSATGPMDLIEAARAAGGRVISPSGSPPALAKSGASTVVTVEVPAAGWAAFSQKLKETGTFEFSTTLPAGPVRIRVEVVKK